MGLDANLVVPYGDPTGVDDTMCWTDEPGASFEQSICMVFAFVTNPKEPKSQDGKDQDKDQSDHAQDNCEDSGPNQGGENKKRQNASDPQSRSKVIGDIRVLQITAEPNFVMIRL